MRYKNFEELPIWQDARKIVNMVYDIIYSNQKLEKDFRITGQLVGASVSIMNNIAEGFDSGYNKEFARFLRISQRSCSEIMSMSYVLNDVYKLEVESKQLYSDTLEERKQIKAFIKYLENN
ncbi:MAG: four helix bundle protein [Ignavibacteriaceae bacterium]